MNLLLILLGVMSFTVQTKSTVNADGVWPYDMDATYTCSYQKGDVREGDTAVLTVTGLGGISIEQVEVYLKSNQSGGAGSFTVSADGAIIATKSGTFKEWFGAWDNNEYHALPLLDQTQDGVSTLLIRLDGTANSLHIEKYVITWAPKPARTVTLMRGNEVYATRTEEHGMSGVVLPELADTAEWRFIGWSEREFYQISTLPETLYYAGSTYYPEADCTLWGVFGYRNSATEGPVTTLQSGVYLYVNSENNYALAGVPDNGIMWPAAYDGLDDNQYYQMDFTDSLDTVYLTHQKTGTPIGYSGIKLAAKRSPWLVYHEGEETILYMTTGGKNYVLWLNVYDAKTYDYYTGLLQANPANSPLVLRLPSTQEEPAYTCHPENGMGIVETRSEEHGAKVIRNGQLLIERDGQVFTVFGIRVN